MSKATHTPGPWRLNENKTMVVTDAMPPYTYGENGQYQSPYIVCQPSLYVTAPLNEARANARLIAAAPDLLAVAEKTDELIQMFVGINSPDEPYLVYSLPREVQDMIFELTAITHAAIATAKGK